MSKCSAAHDIANASNIDYATPPLRGIHLSFSDKRPSKPRSLTLLSCSDQTWCYGLLQKVNDSIVYRQLFLLAFIPSVSTKPVCLNDQFFTIPLLKSAHVPIKYLMPNLHSKIHFSKTLTL